ncbi:uncharacterized protein LOC135846426 [Planococcus citri]|uniref:uncharacterized protein LOC135846426 n=1 Tax=Planococcus citri TaxID=170843 RepID=UPI0031F9D285
MEESYQMPCDSSLRLEESYQIPCDLCLRLLITDNPIINLPSAPTPEEVSNLRYRFLISQNTCSLLNNQLRLTENKLAAAEEQICQIKSQLRFFDSRYATLMNTQSEIKIDHIDQRRQQSIPVNAIHHVAPFQSSSWGTPLLTRGSERLSTQAAASSATNSVIASKSTTTRMDHSPKVPAAADDAINPHEIPKQPENPATKSSSSKPPLYTPDRIPPWVLKANANKPKTDFCDRTHRQFQQQTQEDKENRPPAPKRKREPGSEQRNPRKRVRFNLRVSFRGI